MSTGKLLPTHCRIVGPSTSVPCSSRRVGKPEVYDTTIPKHNQQDATLYNILYYCQCSTSGVLKLFWSAAHYFAKRNIVAHP